MFFNTNRNFLIFLIITLICSITPASAGSYGEAQKEVELLKEKNDIKTHKLSFTEQLKLMVKLPKQFKKIKELAKEQKQQKNSISGLDVRHVPDQADLNDDVEKKVGILNKKYSNLNMTCNHNVLAENVKVGDIVQIKSPYGYIRYFEVVEKQEDSIVLQCGQLKTTWTFEHFKLDFYGNVIKTGKAISNQEYLGTIVNAQLADLNDTMSTVNREIIIASVLIGLCSLFILGSLPFSICPFIAVLVVLAVLYIVAASHLIQAGNIEKNAIIDEINELKNYKASKNKNNNDNGLMSNKEQHNETLDLNPLPEKETKLLEKK